MRRYVSVLSGVLLVAHVGRLFVDPDGHPVHARNGATTRPATGRTDPIA